MSGVKNIAIIGAGTLGNGITQAVLLADFEKVYLHDINQDVLDNAVKKIETTMVFLDDVKNQEKVPRDDQSASNLFPNINLEKVISNAYCVGRFAEGCTPKEIMDRLSTSTDLKHVINDVDYIIESVPEKLELKKKIFQDLHKGSPSHAILSTNSSSLSITRIAESSGRPEKVIGMHFFSPLMRQLIEITKGDQTDDNSVQIGKEVGSRLPCFTGKRKIIILEKESPGFIANRIQASGSLYISLVLDQAYEKGIPWEQLDADVTFLMQTGFCEMVDLIGVDVVFDVLKYLEGALSPDFAPGLVLTKMVEDGNLGQKSGKGFYEWKEDGTLKTPLNKDIKAGIIDLKTLFAIQLNEGCRLLEEGVVSGYKVIDDAMLYGYGNPGPFGMGKTNYQEWCTKLEDLAKRTNKPYLNPCKLMKSGEFRKMKK
ncbi:MAG: 3-hydroxyacyl-CoA dehydrogenase NAD-binding domain-containing protein [Candidatus Hodarchaeota archaeon]